jgi:hypothetical protein
MIGEPLVIRDLAEAAFVVRWVFATYNTDDGLKLVRGIFDERWPAWGDRELVTAMRAALVEH